LIKTGANLDPAAIITKGYSELMPIACNSSDLEREKNRRVEVYLLDQIIPAASAITSGLLRIHQTCCGSAAFHLGGGEPFSL
jgi:hypothetical protein